MSKIQYVPYQTLPTGDNLPCEMWRDKSGEDGHVDIDWAMIVDPGSD